MTHIVKIFSASVLGATFPKPTDVSEVKVKYSAVTYRDFKFSHRGAVCSWGTPPPKEESMEWRRKNEKSIHENYLLHGAMNIYEDASGRGMWKQLCDPQ